MTFRADTLYRNARVLTMDPRRPRATSLATWQGRVVAVGDDLDLPAHRVVDVGGAAVMPGFHDAHQHLAWFGRTLLELNLRSEHVADLSALYAAVADAASVRTDTQQWVVGGGYDQNAFDGRHPDADGLEAVAPGVPVWLRHTSGHMGVASHALLQELGLGDETTIQGGRVGRRPDGTPTGLLEEGATSLVQEALFPYAQEALSNALVVGSAACAREGVTSVTECGIGGGWIGHAADELAVYQQLVDSGQLLQRVTVMPVVDALHDVPSRSGALGPALDLGVRTGFGDDRLRLGAMKIFTDGSLIGHTAAMRHAFDDDDTNRGYLQDDPTALTDAIVGAHRAGWQVAAHAIGDRAIDLVLDAFEIASATPRSGPPHRIEHCALTDLDQVRRIARLGVIPVPQGSLVRDAGDGMRAALGQERSAGCYRMRTFLDHGVCVPASTDRPVVDGHPLANVHALVTRRTRHGQVLAPQEAVTVEEALYAYTMGSAVAAGMSDRLGSLRPGMLADLVVLGADPTQVDADALPTVPVLATVVGDHTTHGADWLGASNALR